MERTLSRQPGYRFHPTDVELVVYYLKNKVRKRRFHPREIAEVDIYKCDPRDLKEKSISKSGDLNWYFFCPVEKKYANGPRLNRSTQFGYWRSTGEYKHVDHNKVSVGSRRTMIFYRKSGKQRERTDWVMHEYSLDYENLAKEKDVQRTYKLCKIFQKEGRGPRNGAQYGAPFKEEDWNDFSDCSDVETAVPADNEDENSMLAEGNTVISRGDEINNNLSRNEIDHVDDPFQNELMRTINFEWNDDWIKTYNWNTIETAGPSVDGCQAQEGISMDDLDSPLAEG